MDWTTGRRPGRAPWRAPSQSAREPECAGTKSDRWFLRCADPGAGPLDTVIPRREQGTRCAGGSPRRASGLCRSIRWQSERFRLAATFVGVVFENRRIEKTVRVCGIEAHAGECAAVGVLRGNVATGG